MDKLGIIERTREARLGSRFETQKAMADALGIEAGLYHKYETRSPMPHDLILKFANLTEKSVEWLLGGNMVELHPAGVRLIPVIGEVQAGVWKEAVQFEVEDQYTIEVGQVGGLADAYGLLVIGDSMDLIYPPGTIIIVSPLGTRPLKNGDKVVVQRKLRTGQIEATVKELEIINGIAKLWPRSKNPKFQEPVNIHWPYEDEQLTKTESVEIVGLVRSSYRIED